MFKLRYVFLSLFLAVFCCFVAPLFLQFTRGISAFSFVNVSIFVVHRLQVFCCRVVCFVALYFLKNSHLRFRYLFQYIFLSFNYLLEFCAISVVIFDFLGVLLSVSCDLLFCQCTTVVSSVPL